MGSNAGLGVVDERSGVPPSPLVAWSVYLIGKPIAVWFAPAEENLKDRGSLFGLNHGERKS